MDGADDRVQPAEQLMRGSDLLGQYNRYESDPPSAELFVVKADLDLVLEAIMIDLVGWNLTTTDDALASALVERGALPTRHFSLMTVDVAAQDWQSSESVPMDAYDIRLLTAESEVPREVIGLVRSAYPPGHPDEELGSDDDIVRDIRRALDGRRLGALMQMSALAFDGERLVGLIMVNRVPGVSPTGGPWVTDLCRDPDLRYAGLGRALLVRALGLCQGAGESSVSLAVTEGNSARRLYESLGFTLVATTRKVRLPG
ncbi:MAG: GNAT family N-acetyltransferase [Actinomycetia bacterium]|nr:GNAT family N-acetyltransferase [Actinomycetes bacterium]